MRPEAVLALASSLLVAVAPLVPAVPSVMTFYEPLSAGSGSNTLLDLAISPMGTRSGPPPAFVLFLIAALCGWLAFTGRARHSWIPALLVVANSGWTLSVLRADWAGTVRYLPGGREAFPFLAYLYPWPWLVLGPAVMLLGAASWWSYREARRVGDAAVSKVFE